MEEDPLEAVLRYCGYGLQRSGLFGVEALGRFGIVALRRDLWSVQNITFDDVPEVLLQASSHAAPGGEVPKEELILEMNLPASANFTPLGPNLESLWNFGEVLAHHAHSEISGGGDEN
jgi:hypothetical protein